ncbi:DNA-binding transcriptional activator of the SARP family [Lentzea xinjiangensis]|uniref:DNA-binding transcriptional activator of the SARP family n=1 Tax=Lentzea xinjiangensis TaxID=402600 RepID=A0A1H9PE87_9PSEU|nr:BTAD domain-containing putative transcriptional regulator [Lentzea xinjiangensis]SER46504.1 DNA-binding transcriptional activator of the SARP family [Lentzea xinjiangensis]
MWPLVRCSTEEVAGSRPGLAFTVFGVVRAWRDGTELDVGSPQQRLTLAVLLQAEGRMVQIPEIIRAIWGEDAPPAARGTVRTYVYRLRKLLDEGAEPDEAVLRSDGVGYRLVLTEEQLDLSRFLGSVRSAESAVAAGERRQAVAMLRAAVEELREEPLLGIPGEWAETERRRLGRLAVRTVELLAEQQLGLDGRIDVLDLLTAVAEAEPLRERVHELMMLALCREGRPAEALAVYEKVRAALREELGVDPGLALRELHARVLREDPALSSPAAVAHDHPAPSARPAPMPAALTVFAGREAELAELNAVLADPAAVRTVVVHGTAGVGKTTFVVQWADRVASLFPDGQFYVNLRGFESQGAAREPDEVLRELLDALGVPAAHRPSDLDGLSRLYRGALTDRRLLLVLDNARDSQQVLPLLAEAPGCVVVITSRRELTALVASTGAHSVKLGLLDTDEAVALMALRLGDRRVRDELPAVRAIATACAHLPLALAVASARIASNPDLRLSHIALQLTREDEPGLDFLCTDDPRSDVRSVLSWSYRALSPQAARMFTLLALLPLSRTTTATAASLAALPLARTGAVLRELSTLCLVNEGQACQYTWHDLLREYAAELLADTVDAGEQQAARRRLVDHYLLLARNASLRLKPTDDLPDLPSIAPGVTEQPVDDLRSALATFTTEHGTLLALVDSAAGRGTESRSWQLAWYLRLYLDSAFLWEDMAAINQVALRRAEAAGDLQGVGYTHRSLARAAAMLDDADGAAAHLDAAVEAFRAAGARRAEGYAHAQAANWLIYTGRVEAGLERAELARALFQETNSREQEEVLREVTAFAHIKAGRYRDVVATLRGSLAPDYDSGSMIDLLRKIEHLSAAYEELGEYRKSAELHELSLKVILEITGSEWARFPYGFEERFTGVSFLLARTLYLAGDDARAMAVQREALKRLHELFVKHHRPVASQHPDRARVGEALANLDVLAGSEPDHAWFAASVEVVEDLAALMAPTGTFHYLVELRKGNQLPLAKARAARCSTGA